MADDEPFQSWEARANAQFAAATARNENTECYIQLQRDDNSSILNQNFPPLKEDSPAILNSHGNKSSHSINTSSLGGYEKSKSTAQPQTSDPDVFQWQLYEKDKKNREDEAAATIANDEQHQWKVDYNLYGMDHLHVSKTKFHHPARDVFSRRKANDDNSQHTTTDFQAAYEEALRLLKWLASSKAAEDIL
ncbi:hypothetical protein LguiA_007600 [Lonicera macranthoides]